MCVYAASRSFYRTLYNLKKRRFIVNYMPWNVHFVPPPYIRHTHIRQEYLFLLPPPTPSATSSYTPESTDFLSPGPLESIPPYIHFFFVILIFMPRKAVTSPFLFQTRNIQKDYLFLLKFFLFYIIVFKRFFFLEVATPRLRSSKSCVSQPL